MIFDTTKKKDKYADLPSLEVNNNQNACISTGQKNSVHFFAIRHAKEVGWGTYCLFLECERCGVRYEKTTDDLQLMRYYGFTKEHLEVLRKIDWIERNKFG